MLGKRLGAQDAQAYQELEIDAQAELLDSPDLREAVESYLEKRQPRSTGE